MRQQYAHATAADRGLLRRECGRASDLVLTWPVTRGRIGGDSVRVDVITSMVYLKQ